MDIHLPQGHISFKLKWLHGISCLSVVSLLTVMVKTSMEKLHKETKDQFVQRFFVNTILQHIAGKEYNKCFPCVSKFLIQRHC